MSFSIRYAIPMNGPGCQRSVSNKLMSLNNVDEIEVDLENQEVVVTGSVVPSVIVKSMQEIGRDAFVRGSGRPDSAAVAILETTDGAVKGLARLIEIHSSTVLFDISVDAEFANTTASVYSFGDISSPPESLGAKRFDIAGVSTPNAAIDPHKTGSNSMVGINLATISNVPLSDLIGRSVHTTSGLTGIIARSAGLWENSKTVCTCSGKNVWEERNDFRKKSGGHL